MDDQYFEAIIQLRGSDDEIFSEVVKDIEKEKAIISKVKEIKQGVDLYISSKKAVIKVGKKLKKKFGGVIKISNKVHSRDRDTQKDIKRLTLCFIPPKFKRGEVVKSDNRILIVSGFDKGIITGKDLIGTKKFKVASNAKRLPIREANISMVEPVVEIIHPDTFQSVKPENNFKLSGEIVSVVIDGHKIWVI